MGDESKSEAEERSKADEIKDADATRGGPRGNVHSEPDQEADFDAPPPMPG